MPMELGRTDWREPRDCVKNRHFGLAMESRQTVAHGETLVITHIFLGLIKDF